jgi:hypothetical protein
MKKLILTLALCIMAVVLVAQAPDYFNYQAVLRNPDGTPMSGTIALQVEFLQGSFDGTSIYLQDHQVTTDQHGLVALKIGDGTFFNEIDWEQGPYFLSLSVDGIHMGTSQLLSVPYALYARKAGHVDDDDPDPTNEIQTLSIENSTLQISGGNSVELPDVITPWVKKNRGIYYDKNVGIGYDMNPEVTLDLQKNLIGLQDRALIRIRNIDESLRAYVAVALETLEDLEAKTYHRSELFLTSEYYTEIPDFNGMTAIRSPGKGVSLCTDSEQGSIRFYTTTEQDTVMERARFDHEGNLGVGTTAPEAKLHVHDGDILVENSQNGLILQSPDGQYYRIRVGNGGNLYTAPVSVK